MRRIIGLVLAGLMCASLTGCAGLYAAPVMPPPGFILSDIKAPLDIDALNTRVDLKTGTAKTTSVLGLFASGDASLKAAADNGEITTIEHIDYKMYNVLGVYSEFTIIVYGK